MPAFENSPRTISARWIVPVHSAPIHNGWIQCVGDRIVGVGKGRPEGAAIDLGDVAILPQLVNAHTHLEFSDCGKPIGQPGIAFHDWIAAVVTRRSQSQQMSTNQAIARDQAIALGLEQSSTHGVGLLADIATPPCGYSNTAVLPDSIPRWISFAEVLGLHADRANERMAAFETHRQTLGSDQVGISPHAPYSTSIDTVSACVARAKQHGLSLAMHVAESPAERQLLTTGDGDLATLLKGWGLYRDEYFPHRREPFLELIETLSGAPRALLIHGNDLCDHEIARLAKHNQISVVFCPRTHNFFQFGSHPVEKMLAVGVRVALGTDSLASNPDLNLWREVQFLLDRYQTIDPAQVLAMATMTGADALGQPTFGRLAPGAIARLAAVATTATSVDQLYGDLAAQDLSPVVLSGDEP